MGILKGLKPEMVFKYFEEICSIPHGSGNVKQISDYLVSFANNRNLWVKQDDYYNVIIKKDGTGSKAGSKPVILQGHIDMVAVKTEDKIKDMEKEGLDLIVDGDYIKADRTSLGGDDGIAVAYALALLDSDYELPPLEAVFTVDEEIGMLGADAIDLSDLEGRIMLNMDSEEEGVFLSGCAGGATVKSVYDIAREQFYGIPIEISIKGLTSGHSGADIACQRANANVLITRLLYEAAYECDIRIQNISGGEKDNVIAPSANAVIVVSEYDFEEAVEIIRKTAKNIQNEYFSTDSGMEIDIIKGDAGEYSVFDKMLTTRIIFSGISIPDGVIKMSNDIEGLVQTSLNLGVVKTKSDEISFTYLLRSSVESEKEYLINRVAGIARLFGANVTVSGNYPAWEYKKESRLRDIMVASYEALYGVKPKIEAIHAGVECGIMTGKLDNLDCVSFGPEILDIHTVKERLSISSVERTWKLILEVLRRL